MKLLGGIFPHLGGPPLDIVDEISSIRMSKNETLVSILHKFISVERKLLLARHTFPPTALFKRYLNLIRQNTQIFIIVAPISRSFHMHMIQKGPDVKFEMYSILDVHEYIKDSGIDTHAIMIFSKNTHSHHQLIPQACGAEYEYMNETETQGPQMRYSQSSSHVSSPMELPSVHQNQRSRSPRCPICFQSHIPTRCWARGAKFQPLWLQRNVAKYNALHANEYPDEKYLHQSPPLHSP